MGHPPEWLPYGDAIRALGALAVVMAHVGHEVTGRGVWMYTYEWWYAAAFDAAGRWAVPAFIMLSGAIFLAGRNSETPATFYRKRLARVGIPLAFWLLFYLLWRIGFQGPRWRLPDLTWHDVGDMLLRGWTSPHLYFLGVMLGLYLFTPMLRIVVAHASRRQLTTVTAIVLVLTVLSDAVHARHAVRDVPYTATMFDRFVPYLGFFLAGYCLRDVHLGRRGLALAWVGFVGSIIATVCLTYFIIPYGAAMEDIDPYFVRQFSPTRVIMAICAFLLFVGTIRHEWPRNGCGRLITHWLGPAALGIYLCHVAFLDLFFEWGLRAWTPNAWVGVPLRVAAAWLAAAILTMAVQRIPAIRRVMG